ncbi:MAG: hypothetical protein KA603_02395 [Azonexus sp.]|nr:hypothetical protein [Betaproteobacteria bacterium]MBK8919726.1 hypothetical protein [Betaproteobacteria bacterium]MBP6034971.1 hypothetical protein [Azonexus sp.]MBP6905677.1 hypothetical protein [Azonexus sp.]
MRAQQLPPAAGWNWIVGGASLYRRNPPVLGLLVVAYWFTVVLLSAMPLIGTVLASLAVPGLSVGLMHSCRQLERRQTPALQTLYGGLRENPRTLAALGALYLACTLAILMLSSLADGGELLRFMLSGQPLDRETVESGRLMAPATIVILLLAPVLMAYWFAPVLAAWHGLSVGKALFFSLMACWINWRAFLTYGIALALVAAVLPGVVLAVLLLIFPGAANFLTALVTVPAMLVLAPIVFASFYVSYRDVFGIDAAA